MNEKHRRMDIGDWLGLCIAVFGTAIGLLVLNEAHGGLSWLLRAVCFGIVALGWVAGVQISDQWKR